MNAGSKQPTPSSSPILVGDLVQVKLPARDKQKDSSGLVAHISSGWRFPVLEVIAVDTTAKRARLVLATPSPRVVDSRLRKTETINVSADTVVRHWAECA